MKVRFRAIKRGGLTIFSWILAVIFIAGTAVGQIQVDKSIALVSDGVRSELITFSDLLWQLALEPGSSVDSPTSADLNRALQTQINQRLFTLEAERVPRAAPTEREISAAITELVSHFPSPTEFEARLRKVGFTSVKDPNFERMIVDRLAIEKYLDFRFRSFVVITPEDEAKYYRDIYLPDFRRRYPGVLAPSLEEQRANIRSLLTEQKVAGAREAFLDDAKRRIQIVMLNEV